MRLIPAALVLLAVLSACATEGRKIRITIRNRTDKVVVLRASSFSLLEDVVLAPGKAAVIEVDANLVAGMADIEVDDVR